MWNSLKGFLVLTLSGAAYGIQDANASSMEALTSSCNVPSPGRCSEMNEEGACDSMCPDWALIVCGNDPDNWEFTCYN